MTYTPHYTVGKVKPGQWRVYLRLSERESIYARLTFKTKREAEAAARTLQRELDDLNRGRDA